MPCDGTDLQGLEIVHDEDGPVGESHEFGVGIFVSPVARIRVPLDRGNRRDPAKDDDDVTTPDIAAMNDVINAGQTAFGFRPQEAVRVGDYADPEGHRWKRLAECMRVYSPRRVSSRRMGIASTRADRSSSDSGLSNETAVWPSLLIRKT